jgi:Flp pilus assembly protein protease CpaA
MTPTLERSLHWRTRVLERVRWLTVWAVLLAAAASAARGGGSALVPSGLTAVFAALAAYDLRYRVVPNAVTLTLWGLATVGLPGRLWEGSLVAADVQFIALSGLVCLGLWEVRALGGGDAKLLLGAFTLLPSLALAQAVIVATLCGGLLTLACQPLGLARLAQLMAQPGAIRRSAIAVAQRERGSPTVVWIAAGLAWHLLAPGLA